MYLSSLYLPLSPSLFISLCVFLCISLSLCLCLCFSPLSPSPSLTLSLCQLLSVSLSVACFTVLVFSLCQNQELHSDCSLKMGYCKNNSNKSDNSYSIWKAVIFRTSVCNAAHFSLGCLIDFLRRVNDTTCISVM